MVEGPQERYRLDWPGKRQALLTANAPIDKTLRPMREDSVDFDTTRNLFIEGDNLDALKLLQETYLGKIKMIYIDPPYNTGKDFIYKDNFAQRREDYEAGSGQRDQEGGRLVANPETNGRFHSDWLSMMYPRLKLARNLLRDDGLIFLSIDDNEVVNLRRALDEIFGEKNFVESFCWKRTYGGGAKEKFAVSVHDYVLLYAKDKDALPSLSIPYDKDTVARYYKYRDGRFNIRGPYRLQPLEAGRNMDRRENLDYPVEVDGRVVRPKRQWLWQESRILEGLANETVIVVKNDSADTLNYKQYLKDEDGVERGAKPTSWIEGIFNQHGSAEVQELFNGTSAFSFPKPTAIITHFISFACNADDILLDFYAGSGTTPHAVMNWNASNQQQISYIAVQLDEPIADDEEGATLGYSNIAQLSRERVRRAGAKILTKSPDLTGKLDIGFRAFRIDSSNFQDTRVAPDQATQATLDGLISHIKDDRTDEDLLFGALLRWGVDVTLPVRRDELLGRAVWIVDPPNGGDNGAALIACFVGPENGQGGVDTELADAMAAMKPLRVLFRDDGFASDAVKENVASRFKQRAPDTVVKVL